MYSVRLLAKIVKATIHGSLHEEVQISEFCIDSRRIFLPKETLFIALVGSHADGHIYIPEAYKRGVRVFLASDLSYAPADDAVLIVVKDPLKALQKIATYHLQKLHMPVVSITGSNGKTIIKEWLYQLLRSHLNVVRNPKSFNSQIGVPLSVMLATNKHNLGIFEAGISRKGEMKSLEQILKPTYGIFSNIGDAHAAGFKDNREKIREKLTLFEHSRFLVYCRDHALIHKEILAWSTGKNVRLISWSLKEEADLTVTLIEDGRKGKRVNALYKGAALQIYLPFRDRASIENALHACTLGLAMGVPDSVIIKQAEYLQPVEMRLFQTEGLKFTQIIHDYYNNDLVSLETGLDFLERQQIYPKKTLILSDLEDIDIPPAKLYRSVNRLLISKKVDRLIGIGPDLYSMAFVFKCQDKVFYKDMPEFLSHFSRISFERESILIKGARSYRFEQIGRRLQKQVHETRFEINLSSLEANLRYFRSRISKKTRIMAMVKAYSYGSGSHEVARLLAYKNVDYLAVAYADEGIHLRKHGIQTPIMVLNANEQDFSMLEENSLEPVVYSLSYLQSLCSAIASGQIGQMAIHLEFDTGMHRLGFNPTEVEKVIQMCHSESGIMVKSVFSHLVASESPDLKEVTQMQLKIFQGLCDRIQKGIGKPILRHIANTGGCLYHPESELDMVRIGIGLYGIEPNASEHKGLEVVGKLISYISQIREVKAWDGIGYGWHDKSDHTRKIAVIAIGYADGIDRKWGRKKGYVSIHGQRAPIVGNVCMDMTMVDVSEIDCNEGDEVTLIGEDPTIEMVSNWSETIPYEVLTGISTRVRRVFIQE